MSTSVHARAVESEPSQSKSLYRKGASAFCSPTRRLWVDALAGTLCCPAGDALVTRATALLDRARADGHATPLLVGAVPFRHDATTRLLMPRCGVVGMDSDGSVRLGDRVALRAHRLAPAAVRMQPSPDGYRANVAAALAEIANGQFDKVVLSRSLTLDAQIDLPVLLQRLLACNPNGYTFAIDLDGTGDAAPHTLIGASPELLLRKRGPQVVSNPLAGSIRRSADPHEDQRRAQSLLACPKNRHEHALVVDSIAAALRPYCRRLEVPADPSLLSTPNLWHLSTELHGELIDPQTSSLQLALALHPTPAVCGHPAQAARAFIEQVEGFDRGLFTGLVGWCDAQGDGEWAVTIRCATVGDHEVTLYAGAGVVAGSDPAAELGETDTKLRTMLGAMELESVLGAAHEP